MAHKRILLENVLDEVIDQKFKEKKIHFHIKGHLEMIIHWTGMKIAWDNLLPVLISMFHAQ